jgi:DNA-binding NtrC family response regulator
MSTKVLEKIKVSGLKLLVADDDEIIRSSLEKMGEMMGFEVHTAADGNEAWETFKLVWPDIAILDIYMPRMNGLMLLAKIKEANDMCPVILITGYTHYKQLVLKNDIKPDGFITKPFSLEKIAKTLVKLVSEVGLVT